MKTTFSILVGSLFFATIAHAQETAPPPPLPAPPAPASAPAPSAAPLDATPSADGLPPPPPLDTVGTNAPPRFQDIDDTRAEKMAPGAAWESKKRHTGFELAVSAGVMFPMGSETGVAGADLNNSFGTQVGLGLHLGGRPIPNLYLGAYGAVGFGGIGSDPALNSDCASISCTSNTYRVGLEAQYHILPYGHVDPWLGYGAGYQVASMSASDNLGNSSSFTLTGWDFADLSFGLDFRVADSIAIGPVVDLNVGQYSSYSLSGTNDDSSGSIPNTGIHEWLTVGGRLVFEP